MVMEIPQLLVSKKITIRTFKCLVKSKMSQVKVNFPVDFL